MDDDDRETAEQFIARLSAKANSLFDQVVAVLVGVHRAVEAVLSRITP